MTKIAENLAEFVEADYRVRIRIREDLESSYSRNKSRNCAANIAFQLAFCYKIGFGVKSDGFQCDRWLENAGRQTNDFEEEKGIVRFTK
jgi:hypothetical protein